MLGEMCSHGIPWSCQCKECDLVNARELVRHWGWPVDEARKLIEQEEKREEV